MQTTEIPNIPPGSESSTMSSGDVPELLSPGGYGVGQSYDAGDGFRFSSKTCLAVLQRLSEKELDDEISRLHLPKPLNFYNKNIEHVTEARFLGVIVDDRLNWAHES